MDINIVESSLNLRIERGRTKDDYTLHSDIALRQLSLCNADIYTNVEFMDCNNQGYLQKFIDAGYNSFVSLDSNGRGILCEVKGEYSAEKISEFSDPHMLHLRIKKDNESIELITVRLLVAGGNIEDFKDRRRQWNKVLNYIETIKDKEHLVITGDFNHGVISEDVRCYRFKPREHFNYQMVLSDLKRKGIELFHMEGTSYRGYMKIDHIATGNKVKVTTATYEDVFGITDQIGIPDHSCIVASVKCA